MGRLGGGRMTLEERAKARRTSVERYLSIPENAEKARAATRRYHRMHPEKIQEIQARYVKNNPKKAAEAVRTSASLRWDKLFGWTPGIHARLRDAAVTCELCGGEFASGRHTKCTDHDHETRNFRGFIHRKCNSVLGLIGDDPVIAEKTATYLRRHGKNS